MGHHLEDIPVYLFSAFQPFYLNKLLLSEKYTGARNLQRDQPKQTWAFSTSSGAAL